jgi:uncharacterized protein (DUF952 family)
MYIYHVVKPEIWDRAKSNSFYEPDGFESEGFIHCSFDDQIDGVLARYFKDAAEVVVLKLDINKLCSKLVSEPSTNGEVFPHIYGPINADAVVEASVRILR